MEDDDEDIAMQMYGNMRLPLTLNHSGCRQIDQEVLGEAMQHDFKGLPFQLRIGPPKNNFVYDLVAIHGLYAPIYRCKRGPDRHFPDVPGAVLYLCKWLPSLDCPPHLAFKWIATQGLPNESIIQILRRRLVCFMTLDDDVLEEGYHEWITNDPNWKHDPKMQFHTEVMLASVPQRTRPAIMP